jgi:actin-related protein
MFTAVAIDLEDLVFFTIYASKRLLINSGEHHCCVIPILNVLPQVENG